MQIAVVGINHNSAPISIREKVSFSESKKIEATDILTFVGIEEIVILSTCNRSEIYIASSELDNAVEKVKDFYTTYFKDKSVGNYMFVKKYDDAVRHIYEVCSGFDSIVLGEDQILGQVKDALATSIELKGSSKVLNKLFREAITLAKEIKTETKLSEKPLSVSYIGVKKLREKIREFYDKKVLLIGLGKMGILALTHLREYGITNIYVSNRNLCKSIEIAEEMKNIKVVRYDDLQSVIGDIDILICATASPHTIIRAEDISTQREKPIYILDLAMPRDVDENVRNISNVVLYDVDSLKCESEENEILRKSIMDKSKDKIDEGISEFNQWKANISVDPVIKCMNKKCDDIKSDTLSYIFRKTDLNHKDKKIIDKMVESAMKRLLREAIINLKETKEEKKRNEYVKVLQELFEFN